MISFKSTLKSITVDRDDLEAKLNVALKKLGYEGFDLGIWLTTNQSIQQVNNEFRGKDKPTDVLSFPYHTEARPGKKIEPSCEEDKNLGDIIISVAFAKKEAERLGVPPETHILRLLIHGLFHLLGYKHDTYEEHKVMLAEECRLLNQLSKRT